MSLMHASSRSHGETRPVIYQLMIRTFGNTNESRIPHGTIEQNGCGKFVDINDAALDSLRAMGFNHLWLTGVLEQASATSYPGRPADDLLIVKGEAGSPYAIRDYYDVSPDYAVDPERRLEEFKALLERCHRHGFRVLIDFVPNHVARSYQSDVRPGSSFGEGDDTSVFFERDNHFYYLHEQHCGGSPPMRLPCVDGLGNDEVYEPEARVGRVTGNNAITWTPSPHDWYETVKLNYGHDFRTGRQTSHLPGPTASVKEVPRTWSAMDDILAYWQEMGVDGFRCDMAHMIPMEFWRWVIRRCRQRHDATYFFAEAYDNDPAKLCDGYVLDELLRVGFDAVYDDPVYDILEGIYDDGKWANDLDALTFTGARFHRSLRYAENHDEVRIANPRVWGGHGMRTGKPVTAILFGLGRGPLMMYHGQEVGEPAEGFQGYAGSNCRTTIFDYWSMPEFCKWYHGGTCDGALLSDAQRELRDWYGRLIRSMQSPAFTRGCFYGLNHANKSNPGFGRVDGEEVSGHWIYAYLRRHSRSGDACLVIANLHPSVDMHGVRVRIPEDARTFLGHGAGRVWSFADRLGSGFRSEIDPAQLPDQGLELPLLPSCSAMVLEISSTSRGPKAIA